MKNKKKTIIITLTCLLLFMGTVFAVISTTLNIKSIGHITGVWDIRMTKVEVYDKTDGAEATLYSLSSEGLSLDLASNLSLPGDYVKYQITVRNNGTINGTVNAILKELISGNDSLKFEYDLVEGTEINSNSEITFNVKISYPENAEIIDFNAESKYKLTIDVKQTKNNSN